MTYGDFMVEEQQARIQAIKDSEFRAANDEGEPATDLAESGLTSISPPEGVRITVEDEEFGEDFTVKVTIPDLLAAVREGVESGTEVVWRCELTRVSETGEVRGVLPGSQTWQECFERRIHQKSYSCGWALVIPVGGSDTQ